MSMQYSKQRERGAQASELRASARGEWERRDLRRERAARGHTGEGGGGTLVNSLGWFSLALGLAELAAPREVARLIGVPDDESHQQTLRACGLREIATGAGILLNPSRPTGWVWARVAGDVMDLALLGGALRSPRSDRERVMRTAAAVAGVTLLDVAASQASDGGMAAPRGSLRSGVARALGTGERKLSDSAVHVKKAITIQRSHEEMYQYWRTLDNLPRIMSHLASVSVKDERLSHWKAKAPAGMTIEWDAEIVKDEPHSIIAWRSLPGADIQNAGSVRFKPAPAGKGTELLVEIYYRPPGGKLGKAVAKLLGEIPEVQLMNDLRAFKQVMELGERVHSDASVHRGPHPAQPSRTMPRLETGSTSKGSSNGHRRGDLS
jgi:uncharacterized membrane protein